ncbi:LysR family transcriptional regulator [Paramicrobacterium fandaimingii]|uniref:LysR family transcriptional regulator n=1 Tax=Paramicrobacterium fandaimingii TaxID=2708079 RepID=UPI00141F7ADE|nr:LysR family transcriptional regulator [Microbacterium fandaimingii]
MNVEQLRGFVEIARLGHFTRAADGLHLAQPSLSRQIASLERELGAKLFHRAHGHITLTAAGELLMPRAKRMLADADAITSEMGELAGLQRGRVRLGATPTLCVSLVAEALNTFHAEHPGIDLEITEGGSHLLIEQLAGGNLDMALITVSDGPPTTGAALSRTPLLTEELVVVSSASQPAIAAPHGIDIDQLAQMPLIAFHESYDLRAATDLAFRSADRAPRIVVEGAEMDAVLRFVERGLGVAVVPATVLLDRPTLRSARLSSPLLTRTISLARRSDVTPTRAAAAMREVIIATGGELVERAPTTISLVKR